MLLGGRGQSPKTPHLKDKNAGTVPAHSGLWPILLPMHTRSSAGHGCRVPDQQCGGRSCHARLTAPQALRQTQHSPSSIGPASFGIDKPVTPILRKAEQDLLPSGDPNTPWRRLAYELRMAPTLHDVHILVRENYRRDGVWGQHHIALALIRFSTLLYPKAVAASAADGVSWGAPSYAEKMQVIRMLNLFEKLLNKKAVRQIQGFHIARLIIIMSWMQITGAPADVMASQQSRQQQGQHHHQPKPSEQPPQPERPGEPEKGQPGYLAAPPHPILEPLIRQLQRLQGWKLASVASVDPTLFARLVRALAQLAPNNDQLWVELQRLSLAALLQAETERRGAGASAAWNGNGAGRQGLGKDAAAGVATAAPLMRMWGTSGGASNGDGGDHDGSGSDKPWSASARIASSAEASTSGSDHSGSSSRARGSRPGLGTRIAVRPPPLPEAVRYKDSTPDCTTADLATLAFGFAAAGRAVPPLFDAIRSAVLSRPLPPEPDTLSKLLWAWGRAQLPPGYLAPRVLEAFRPLLDTTPPRALARLLWAMAAVGIRNHSFLAAAGEAIVRRRLVFGSPQELMNVCWAFSHLGMRVDDGEELEETGRRQQQQQGQQQQQEQRQRHGRSLRDAREEDEGTGREDLEKEVAEQEQDVSARRRRQSVHSGKRAMEESLRDSTTWQRPSSAPSAHTSTAAGDSATARSPLVAQAPTPFTQRPPALQPLPLAAVLPTLDHRPADAASRAAAAASGPALDPSSPRALFWHLAHSYLTGEMSSKKWAMSNSQLTVLAASFARVGYSNRKLFYTIARMAMRRMSTLSPQDLVLLLMAFAKAGIRHDGVSEAAFEMVEKRRVAFTPLQLSNILWAAQRQLPRARYSQMVALLRRDREPQVGPAGGQDAARPAGGHVTHGSLARWRPRVVSENVSVSAWAEEGLNGGAAGAAAGGERGSGHWEGSAGYESVLMRRLHVPRHLLEDSDWAGDDDSDSDSDNDEDSDGSVWSARSAPRVGAEAWRDGTEGVGVGPGRGAAQGGRPLSAPLSGAAVF